jgi:hypothetical protein
LCFWGYNLDIYSPVILWEGICWCGSRLGFRITSCLFPSGNGKNRYL